MELTVVIPFYNEEQNIPRILSGMEKVLDSAGIDYELIAVDNGSGDRTSKLIDAYSSRNRRIRKARVETNLGYGHGVLTGLGQARGKFIGWMDGDGQVSPERMVALYRLAKSHGRGIFKARRSKRQDGFQRRSLSHLYNLMSMLILGVKSSDINAKPKLFLKEDFERMNLRSKDWFLDTELLIKAGRLGLSMHEIEVDSVRRKQGKSNVSYKTACEFLVNLVKAKAGRL
jgi:polyisoprenyl-phosphate glycosyltransferase